MFQKKPQTIYSPIRLSKNLNNFVENLYALKTHKYLILCILKHEIHSRAKSILHTTHFTALYDKGYHTGSEFALADNLGVDIMVAIPHVAAEAPDPRYNVENFTYNKTGDYYICPEGQKLTTTGTWHEAKTYRFKRYTTKACMACPSKPECSKAKYGKGTQRSEFQEYINNNKQQIENNKAVNKKRQAIVEHPYGTIKLQWGFNYIITKKSIHRASADVGFMMVAYNLRRLINIVGLEVLKEYLKNAIFLFWQKNSMLKIILRRLKVFAWQIKNEFENIHNGLNRIILTRKIITQRSF